MTRHYKLDITPSTYYLLALQNADWQAKDAIAELVDNSFGPARGNAWAVDIVWEPRHRTLIALDDGNGMDRVGDLFQLGKGQGRSPKDIGKYGSGGTMACVWLASEVKVWTLRDGAVSSAEADWTAVRSSGRWEVNIQDWEQATAGNTPVALLEKGHGTLIRMKVPVEKRFTPDIVKKLLAKTYAPGLRQGRAIHWLQGDTVEGLQSHQVRPGVPLQPVQIEDANGDLLAHGFIGIDQRAGPSESGIALCYGPRVIRHTRDCFRAPAGARERSYSGTTVVGYFDLEEGVQDKLTTTKNDFADAGFYDDLMGRIFFHLEPLLQQVETAAEEVQIEELALELSVGLGTMFNVDLPQAPKPRYTWTRTDEGEVVPEIVPDDERDKPEPEKTLGLGGGEGTDGTAKTSIRIKFVPSEQLNRKLFDAIVDEVSNSIELELDRDHPYVKEARASRSPLAERMLACLIVPALGHAILDSSPRFQRRILRQRLRDYLEELDGRTHKASFLTAHFLNLYRGPLSKVG